MSLRGVFPDACLLGSLWFWSPINRGPQTFWDSFGHFLPPKFSFLLPLSSIFFPSYNSHYCFPIIVPFAFPTVPIFCLTTTLVAAYLVGDPAIPPSFGLGGLSFFQQCSFWVMVSLYFLILAFYFHRLFSCHWRLFWVCGFVGHNMDVAACRM